MAKKRIALLLAVCLLCSLFCGCGKKVTQEEAYQIVLEDLGEIGKLVEQPHIHTGTYEGKPCYNIYITVNSISLCYVISENGKILTKGPANHSH